MDIKIERRLTRLIFAFSFLISTLALMLLALRQPLRANIAISYMFVFILVGGWSLSGKVSWKHRWIIKLILLISVLNLLLVPPEVYLKLKGFRYESGIQFGYPRPYQFKPFEVDEKLFWRFPPSEPGINSYGFREGEIEPPKPAGTLQILFLGNSCTYQGHPEIVETILHRQYRNVECLNFATPGYTTYQGKVVARSFIDELDPDLIVVSFGWNDRWLAYREVDEDKKVEIADSKLGPIIKYIYSKWRLLQFLRKLMVPVLGGVDRLDRTRVPAEQFGENLRAIGGEGIKRRIPVLFVTEPSSHPTRGVPDYVVESHYAVSKESSLGLFHQYNDIIRDVAAEDENWHLLDLDSLISNREDVQHIFTDDGIHFTSTGMSLIAEIESRRIEEILDSYRPAH